MNYALSQRVGNYKTGKAGKIASGLFKGAHGDFSGYVVLTDHYGYEIWEEAFAVAFPPDFVPADAPPA